MTVPLPFHYILTYNRIWCMAQYKIKTELFLLIFSNQSSDRRPISPGTHAPII